MGNEDFTTTPDESTKTVINKSGITKNEKIIIGILLGILSLLLIAFGKKILPYMPGFPIGHGSIMVGGNRYHGFFGIDSVQYIFSFEQSKRTNIKLFSEITESAELSPDGQWILFSTIKTSSGSQVYIMRTDGTQQTRVPVLYGGKYPTWSPDGKQIAFFGYESGPGIYIANVECLLRGESCTPAFRLLIKAPGGYELTSPDWSPDGGKIAYTTATYTSHISVINIYGQQLPFQNSGASADPQWSPDGTKIVGTCYGTISGVCLMNSDGSNLVYLRRNTTKNYASRPKWSPDGQMIAFISTFSNNTVPGICINPDGCGNPIYPRSVFIMNADGSGLMTHLPLENDVVINWFFWYP